MARRSMGLESLIDLIADRVRVGVTEGLRKFLDEEFEDLRRTIGGAGRRGPGRPPGRARRGRPPGRARRGRPPKGSRRAPGSAVSRARSAKVGRILEIVRAAGTGITSGDVAKKMRLDGRGVGILLSGLAKNGELKRQGKLYRAA